jgi:hypothetical protein
MKKITVIGLVLFLFACQNSDNKQDSGSNETPSKTDKLLDSNERLIKELHNDYRKADSIAKILESIPLEKK